jgi:hypothetical protein
VERLHLGELPKAEADALRATLGADELAALADDDAHFAADYPASLVLPRVRARAAARGRPSAWWLLVPALAVAASAALMVPGTGTSVAASGVTTGADAVEDTRIKGLRSQLLVHRLRGDGGVEKLADGALGRPGDRLQLAYVAGQHRYGAVASVDGRGNVTWHLPATGAAAATLEPKGQVVLPTSFELDDAPAYERFVFVAADAPFTLDSVQSELAAARAVTDDAARDVITFTVLKED